MNAPALPRNATKEQFLKWWDWHHAQAIKQAGKLYRVQSGFYLLYRDGQLIEICYETELAGRDKWIARCNEGDDWNGNPFATLGEVLKDLEYSGGE